MLSPRRPLVALSQVAVVTAIMLGVGLPTAQAGSDCEPGQGWSLLKKLAAGKVTGKSLGDGNNDIDLCILGPNALPPSRRHWYRKGKKRDTSKVSEEGKKIAKLCAPAFAGPKRKLAKELCVALLADVGVVEIAGKRTLDLGNEIYECGFPLKQMPYLPSSDAARSAEAQWDQDKMTFCGFGGCDCHRAPKAKPSKRRMRYRNKFLKDHKFDVLNALSWVGDAKSITWLSEVAIKDADSEIRERAEKVLEILRSDR